MKVLVKENSWIPCPELMSINTLFFFYHISINMESINGRFDRGAEADMFGGYDYVGLTWLSIGLSSNAHSLLFARKQNQALKCIFFSLFNQESQRYWKENNILWTCFRVTLCIVISLILKYFFNICFYAHMCVHQRTAFRSWSCPSTMRSLHIELGSLVKLGGKHLTCWAISPAKILNLKNRYTSNEILIQFETLNAWALFPVKTV